MLLISTTEKPKITILDTYVKKHEPPPEETRPSKRIVIAAKKLKSQQSLAEMEKLSTEFHVKVRAAGFTVAEIKTMVRQAIREKRNESKSTY